MRPSIITAVAAAALLAAGTVAAATAGASETPTPTATSIDVRRLSYHLGDQAFTYPGYDGRSELAAEVTVPADLARGKHPLIVIEHGQWDTCADPAAQKRLDAAKKALAHTTDPATQDRLNEQIEAAGALLLRWPCVKGTPQIPSYQGYRYLATALAQDGFVVASIGTNGINASSFGQADTVYQARAALLNRHLAVWQQLSEKGTGPLGAALGTAFTGHVDLTHVGTVGHSMGGGGVMQQIADGTHQLWPAGVRVAGTFTLAPTDTFDVLPVTGVPFAQMWGTCDQVNSGTYFHDNAASARKPIFEYTLTGGNHDFYNTQWSPSSGQVGADDDAVAGTGKRTCQSQFPDQEKPVDQPRLPEARQRELTVHYATAFFEHFLQGKNTLGTLRAAAGPEVKVAAAGRS